MNNDPSDEHQDQHSEHDPLSQRVGKVEDRAAFTEHTVDQINEQLVKAYTLMSRLEARLADIERRLEGVEAAADGGMPGGADGATGDEGGGLEPPPHSASADERRAIAELRRAAGRNRGEDRNDAVRDRG